jgi:hypothetical protein
MKYVFSYVSNLIFVIYVCNGFLGQTNSVYLLYCLFLAASRGCVMAPWEAAIPTLGNATVYYSNTELNIVMAGAKLPDFCLIHVVSRHEIVGVFV